MGNKNKLYAAAVTVCNENEVRSFPIGIVACSEEEAVGKALNHYKEKMPQSKGWRNHQAVAIEIPAEMIQRVQR